MSGIENLKELRVKYLNGNRRTEDQILTSLCLVHGYHRKSANRVMYGELRRLMAPHPSRTWYFSARSELPFQGPHRALEVT
jgi:hypothetical protein